MVEEYIWTLEDIHLDARSRYIPARMERVDDVCAGPGQVFHLSPFHLSSGENLLLPECVPGLSFPSLQLREDFVCSLWEDCFHVRLSFKYRWSSKSGVFRASKSFAETFRLDSQEDKRSEVCSRANRLLCHTLPNSGASTYWELSTKVVSSHPRIFSDNREARYDIPDPLKVVQYITKQI